MGGRGTFAAGNSVPYSYKTVGFIEGVKVLERINGKHALPESSHSSDAYIKLKPDGINHLPKKTKSRPFVFTKIIPSTCLTHLLHMKG